jgi:hypothetical protein
LPFLFRLSFSKKKHGTQRLLKKADFHRRRSPKFEDEFHPGTFFDFIFLIFCEREKISLDWMFQ